MTLKNRCVWCARRDDTVREISVPMIDRWGASPSERPFWVHGEHEDAFRAFAGLANRNTRPFVFALVGIPLALLIMVIAAAAFHLDSRLVGTVVGAGVALMGVVLVRWPFAMPETVEDLGIDLSIKMVRVYGCVFIVAGLAMAAFLP